ncbi:hypothetical protein GGI25_002822 [Coemansia spiralis]|uniref:Dbl homology domain-containing protein n=2 Tax=Coemansia TaxID=4863 RepID=A0A9W8G342_9FUNG|nr:hypothetical protein EDC05_004917 [Coemansia umbellata]KAJ2677870.1 hypothetical protein GGI25_002822 [Coemansia spiralis]
MLIRRTRIASEILATERTYVDGLGLIEKLYISPLLASAQQHTPILSRKEVRQLFANFPDIITLSRELLAQLEARLGASADPPWDPAAGRIGDIFLKIAPFLKMYSLYLRNFRSALADISRWLSENHEFAQFIQEANSSPECKGLSFQSYLLLPVQRIPRYKLLLNDLLKHTPAAHIDRQSIADALRMIEDVAAFVNENIQEHEMTLSIIEIQRTLGLKESLLVPGRRLVKIGTLTKICRKNHQLRSFYLFSDILLYSNGPAPLMDDQYGHRKVSLEDCKVMDVPDTYDCRNQFTIISREKSFIVYANNPAGKESWMHALAAAITERRAARETLQMDNSLKRRIARARRSTMMHFPRVAENFDAPVWDPDESAEHCYICFREFTLFLRRHHCRACGKIVCNSCSRKNIVFVGQSSTESKEGRGCDQCIARLFGREALESPPGTIHKFLTRSRHSLDPGSLIQSLSALTMGTGGIRNLPGEGRPAIPWGRPRNNSIDERDLGRNGATSPSDLPAKGGMVESYPLPTITQVVCEDTVLDTHLQQSPSPNDPDVAQMGTKSSTPDKSYMRAPRPPTPLPSVNTAGASRSSIATVRSSLASSSMPKPSRFSLVAARCTSKHTSTGSIPEWDSMDISARSTLLYDTVSPIIQLAETNSPVSTMTYNRASLVSSTCSTIVSDSSSRAGRSRTRRPILFAAGGDTATVATEPALNTTKISFLADSGISSNGNSKIINSNSHCSLLAFYENPTPAATNSQPSLVSQIAPPKLSLVLAEAVGARSRSNSCAARSEERKGNSKLSNPTLCSLCHGDFTIQDSQHQCSSCLSLVCPRCIIDRNQIATGSSVPATPSTKNLKEPPRFARVLSMYIPSGYEHMPGDKVCRSCATCAGSGREYETVETS